MQALQPRQWLALALLIPFLVLTFYAIYQFGPTGIFEHLFINSAGWQALADLVIALILLLTWLVPEAKRLGKNPWPWVIATFLVGAISPLFYMVTTRLPVATKTEDND